MATNYEAAVDELDMPRPAQHRVCPDCGTEFFLPGRCPTCLERDRLAAQPLVEELRVSIPAGTLSFAAPWGAPDWRNLETEGDFLVANLDDHRKSLLWVQILLPSGSRTWVKVGAKFGVKLYKRRVRKTA